MNSFEQQYIEVRKKEQQYYTNDEVAQLPDISPRHQNYAQWQLRKSSCDRLINYLTKIEMPLKILEVGCGNGWLSAKMAGIKGATVTGIDVNETELNQGRMAFKNLSNLHFDFGDIAGGALAEFKFDIIVFAASLQYFSSLSAIMEVALKLLTENGEVHILDTPLYKDEQDAAGAKQRSKDYYSSLGSPDMAAFYFHHTFNELKNFTCKTMYDPSSIINKFTRTKNPFYWVKIFHKPA